MNELEATESTPDSDSPEVSKSQRKREAQELLELAKKLITMPASRLQRMPLDQDLREEVGFARSIRAHGARKRQLMTVGKMLRKRDTRQLLDAVNNADKKNRQVTIRHHLVEAWRDRLIDGGDQELSELLQQVPAINAQTLRQLIRNARKEAGLGKPPAAARKIFKLLRDADTQNPLP